MDQLKSLLKALSRQGFTYRYTANSHVQIYSPQGWLVATGAGTGGLGRGHRNLLARLRKAGFEWKGR